MSKFDNGKYHSYVKGMEPPCHSLSRIVIIDTHGISTWCQVRDIKWNDADIVAFKINYVAGEKDEQKEVETKTKTSPFQALHNLLKAA